MKKITLLLALSFMIIGGVAQAQGAASAKNGTTATADAAIKMLKDNYDIGKITQNETATFYIEFANQTNKPLVVKSVMADCGCTVPEKPTEPIMPGKTGKIKVSYTPPSTGPVKKGVQIYLAGYGAPKIVLFTGEVLAKK